MSAVDGPIVVGDFGEPHTNGACDHEGQCVLLAVWADVGEHMRRYLDGVTLADIARIAQGEAAWPSPVDRTAPDPAFWVDLDAGATGTRPETVSAGVASTASRSAGSGDVERQRLAGRGWAKARACGVQERSAGSGRSASRSPP